MREDSFATYLRSLVVGADTPVSIANGSRRAAINFDNAATTPPLKSVMREIVRFAPWYASIHRGAGVKSIMSSEMFEQSRDIIKKFVHADADKDVVICTKNTTESINILAYTLAGCGSEEVILSTDMEHLANDLPWQGKFKVDYAAIDGCGRLSLESLRQQLTKYKGKVRLVAVTGASNVTGYINPVHTIAQMAHEYGAEVFVDGAQLVPHCAIDMKPHDSAQHIDYLAFSGHKMYAPFGGGVLIGRKGAFEHSEPVYKGGGIAKLVTRRFIDWDSPPYKEEAGTPNAMAAVAMVAAIRKLSGIGLNVIHDYEHNLICYAIAGMRSIPGLELYSCAAKNEKRVSLISFTLQGIHHKMLADILSVEGGISVRNGLFCAHPYVIKLLKLSDDDIDYYYNKPNARFPGLVRISLGLYNNYREIDMLLELLHRIACNRDYYKRKYSESAKARLKSIQQEWLLASRRKLP
ncbi:putative cysteine desulfurase [bioreactor metagenome]|uniref:Putative cysteine desulfurase n=1 Tax=bioreactor metagenome TaxID=1076179 RepID=A0A644U8H8_9ZZZZ|nr:aminotransferase class V-fold PLP-dependent enzyme [Negativicutes bacterium]